MEARLALKYSGPSVDVGLMDVYQVSANMIAFSEFVVTAAKIAYGDKITVNAEVAGFGKGSFLTDLVFNFANHSIPIFTSFSPSELLWSVDISKIGIYKQLVAIVRANHNPLIQKALLSNVNRP